MGAHGFRVGDYVRHDRDGYDPTPGSFIEGRVTRIFDGEIQIAVERCEGTDGLYRSGVEYKTWPDAPDDFKRLRKVSAPFKLKAGEKVKNLRTGRVGYVYESVMAKPGKLIVIPGDGGASMSFDDYQSAPLASELEAYEAEHPGTYDIVTEGAPW